jgi:hypothetical protein
MMMGAGLLFMLLIGLVVVGPPLLIIVMIVGGGLTALFKSLPNSSQPPASAGAPAALAPTRKCPTCGREVRPGWNVCPTCGAALT